MSPRHPVLILLLVLSLFSGPGCKVFKETVFTPSEAETKFLEICRKNGTGDISTRTVGKTLWVYAPLNEDLFAYRVSPADAEAKRKKTPFYLLYFKAGYETQAFTLAYDIVPDVTPKDVPNYGSTYSEAVYKKLQLILSALQESVTNIPEKDAPVFLAVMVADIKHGLATKSVSNLKDFKRSAAQVLPPEEYQLRQINDIVGDTALIGDTRGVNVKYADIVWGEFLAKQMENRANFKFTRSDFPPETDPDKQIAGIAANTLAYYPEFTDYTKVNLSNMRDKRDMSFAKDQLDVFKEKALWEETRGRLTTVHFSPDGGLVIGDAPDKPVKK